MILKSISGELGKLTQSQIALISILGMQIFGQMFGQHICAQELGQFVQFAPPRSSECGNSYKGQFP